MGYFDDWEGSLRIPKPRLGTKTHHRKGCGVEARRVRKWSEVTCQACLQTRERGATTPKVHNFSVKDIVAPIPGQGYLRSGCSSYDCAIVVDPEKFVLVSREGDMLWSTTLKPEHFEKIGEADMDAWQKVQRRWTPEGVGVHIGHCCARHGCRYGEDEDCPVANGTYLQTYPCEQCSFLEEEVEDLLGVEGAAIPPEIAEAAPGLAHCLQDLTKPRLAHEGPEVRQELLAKLKDQLIKAAAALT